MSGLFCAWAYNGWKLPELDGPLVGLSALAVISLPVELLRRRGGRSDASGGSMLSFVRGDFWVFATLKINAK